MTDINHPEKARHLGSEGTRADVVVVGGGPAGLTAAIALAGAGIRTVIVSKSPAIPDNRTTALLGGSVRALETLAVWEACRNAAAPLAALRIIDDTARIFRAPEVMFHAAEIGLEAFGYNIENRNLLACLEARAGSLPHLTRLNGHADRVEIEPERVRIHLTDGTPVEARLAIGADGRRSACREAAGIATSRFDYGQAALTLNLAHTRPHQQISTEFHTESGPFTLVPLPGMRSSLVWVGTSNEAERRLALSPAALEAAVQRRSHSILGKVSLENPPCLFPLGAEIARSLVAPRTALVGEAAHVLPPIGAQGLNLGLRDAATIAEVATAAIKAGEDPGAPDILAGYERARRTDATSRAITVDLLNRSLLSDFLPIQGVRGLGLYLIDRIGPLRRALMREGVLPTFAAPRLMRGEPL